MTRNENQMYSDVSSIAKSLEKIANALEKRNKLGKLVYKDDGTVDFKPKDIPGFEGTLDALDNLCNVRKDDDDVQNDYLNDLVQGMNQIEFLQFHSSMNFSFASNDSTAMSDAIYELEYEECLGAIRQALHITGDYDYLSAVECSEFDSKRKDELAREYIKDLLENESLKKDDPYTYETDLQGIRKDDDHDIRVAASNFEEDYATKKDAILDYVENEFSSRGARYTDIIKFAYYLGAPNAPKYTSRDRGYYACAFATRFGGHLIQGGKDFLVKGINKNGKERYFTHSSVNKFTDYWKRIQ